MKIFILSFLGAFLGIITGIIFLYLFYYFLEKGMKNYRYKKFKIRPVGTYKIELDKIIDEFIKKSRKTFDYSENKLLQKLCVDLFHLKAVLTIEEKEEIVRDITLNENSEYNVDSEIPYFVNLVNKYMDRIEEYRKSQLEKELNKIEDKKSGSGMMQGLCSEALNFIYKSGFGEYYITNFYKNWEELYDTSSVKIDSDGFHNYYDPCFYNLLVCVVNLDDPYEFISFIKYNRNKDTIQKFFDNLIYSIEEKKKLLKDIKIQASFEVEEILDKIKLNDTNGSIENEKNKKQSEGFYL